MDINLVMRNTLMALGVLGCLLSLQIYDNINNQLRSYKYKPNFTKAYVTGVLSLVLLIMSQFVGKI